MIKDKKVWEEFERKRIASAKPDYKQNMKIFQMMLDHVNKLKILPLKNPLDGFEYKIRISKYLNDDIL